MKFIELTLANGDKISFLVGRGPLNIREGENGGSKVQEGSHNNGGWPIRESYKKVMEMLKKL